MRGLRTRINVGGVLVCALATCVLAVGAYGGSDARPTLFDYDRSAPLDLVLGKTTISGSVARQKLTFNGAGSDRLGADFLHPVSGGPWPLVIWSPGFGGGRSQDLPQAQALARAGVASLLVDPPPGTYDTRGSCTAARDLPRYVSYVISRRRAIDVAEKLPSVNIKRLAAVGFSYGAEITGTLAGLEEFASGVRERKQPHRTERTSRTFHTAQRGRPTERCQARPRWPGRASWRPANRTDPDQ